MAISEDDVAILIPVRNGERFVARAVESALGTGAGEIIISDNASEDGTSRILERFRDRRLRILRQPEVLGLWENHLALLHSTGKPWIKILHADDEIARGGLYAMTRHGDDRVAIVGVVPLFRDVTSGRIWSTFVLQEVRRWESVAYLERLLTVGNELGTPSHVLFRRSAMSLQPAAWRFEISADLVANVMAASRGDVVLLPPGPIITAIHDAQDTRSQGLPLMMKRLRNSVDFLSREESPPIRRFAAVFGAVETIGAFRTMAGMARRGNRVPGAALSQLFGGVLAIKWLQVIRALPSVARMLRWKYWRRQGRIL